VQYAKALEYMDKVEGAEARYREALELVRHAPEWEGAATGVVNSYIAFLCQHGRRKEAAEFSPGVPIIRQMPCKAEEGVETPTGPEQAHASESRQALRRYDRARKPARPEQVYAGTSPIQQPLPPLYIVAVPEKGE
jgi:hypothetical protein